MSFIGILYSIANCRNCTILYIRGLINLNYTFNMPFKVSLKVKAIIFRFHGSVHLKILPNLLGILLDEEVLFLLKKV